MKRKLLKALPRGREAAPDGAARGIDFDAVRELARIASEFDLAEAEADPTGRIRVRRSEESGAGGATPIGKAARAIALAPPPGGAAVEGGADAGTFVTSPFVGTFYRAPAPEAAPFVEVGQTVRKGQVVCIVEAMKLMNEIEVEVDGKVLEVLVKNGEHVEYGQKLLRLAKS